MRAPTPGAIALGILLPIPGALSVASRRTSVASTDRMDGTRESSRLSFSSSSLGHSRSSVDHAVARPSVDSARRSYYTAGLATHSESDDDADGSPAPAQHKAAKRFSGLLKRVSSVVRLSGAFSSTRERRLFPVTWGKAR